MLDQQRGFGEPAAEREPHSFMLPEPRRQQRSRAQEALANVDVVLKPKAGGPAGGSDPSALPKDGPWIGTDESGKGDYFGPLVNAAVFADADVAEQLRAAGVRTSTPCWRGLTRDRSRIYWRRDYVPASPKFSLVESVCPCKTGCFAVFGWWLLGYAGLTARSSNARFWSSVGVVSCW